MIVNVFNLSILQNLLELMQQIELIKFNTNNVTNMSGMFYLCSSLKELNISNFNTNNVKCMFGCLIGVLH